MTNSVAVGTFPESYLCRFLENCPVPVVKGSLTKRGDRRLLANSKNAEQVKLLIKKWKLYAPDYEGLDLTVIVTCHNYACYLDECLLSVAKSTIKPKKVLVIDDSSDTCVKLESTVEVVRVEYRDVLKARRHGLEMTETKYVAFLDADNRVSNDYFETSIETMESDRSVAFVFPRLFAFGLSTGFVRRINEAPDRLRYEDISFENLCDANGIYRTDVLFSTLAMNTQTPSKCNAADWRVARNIFENGRWNAAKSKGFVHYRVHQNQMSKRETDYFTDCDLENEQVTIVIAYSGRQNCWEHQRQWLYSQSWKNIKLLIMNGSHSDLSTNDLGLSDWKKSLCIERYDAGARRLADEDRRSSIAIRKKVEAAVAGIYNKAIQMTTNEFLFFLEDDVIPLKDDAIQRLMYHMSPKCFAVSGLYRHRYEKTATAFSLPVSKENMLPLDGPEVQKVDGTGFGCLLTRRSVLLKYPLSGDSYQNPHYDCALAEELCGKYDWILVRSVLCDHMVNV